MIVSTVGLANGQTDSRASSSLRRETIAFVETGHENTFNGHPISSAD